ncbi:MAG: ferritin family protein [bacterium]|nr:ferritin family protein [bacterium]
MTTNEKLIKIFQYALNQEKTGLSFFQMSLERLGTGAAVTAFKQLIEDEKKHVVFISNIIKDLEEGGEINVSSLKGVTIEPTDFFDERAKSEFFEQCVQSSMIPDVTVFNTALLIERDLSEFYAKMAETFDEEKSRAAFTMLADWEKDHEKFFQNIRDELSKEYDAMPWGG